MSASKPQRQAALWAQGLILFSLSVIYSPYFWKYQYMAVGLGCIIGGDFYPGEMTY